MIFVGIMPLNVGTRLFERPGEYEVCELKTDPGLSAGQVAHVDQDGVEGDAGLVRQLLLVQQPPQQRLWQYNRYLLSPSPKHVRNV